MTEDFVQLLNYFGKLYVTVRVGSSIKEIQSIHILSCQYYYQLAFYIRQAVMIMRGRVWFIHHDLSTNQNESDIRYRIMRIIRIWVDILMFYEGSCLNDAFLIYHISFLCQSSIYFCSLWSINADILCSFAFGEVRQLNSQLFWLCDYRKVCLSDKTI